MAAGGVLNTVFVGTVLQTGKTFTHGLGTDVDFIYVSPETIQTGTGPFVLTFNSQICVIGGPADGSQVRVHVKRFHSIVG